MTTTTTLPTPVSAVGLISEQEAAEYLSLGVGTLRSRRKRGQLPSGLFVRPSPRRLAYPLGLLRRWVELGCPPTWPAGEPAIR